MVRLERQGQGRGIIGARITLALSKAGGNGMKLHRRPMPKAHSHCAARAKLEAHHPFQRGAIAGVIGPATIGQSPGLGREVAG